MSAATDDFATWMLEQGMSQNTIGQRAAFAERLLREWGTWDVSASSVALWLRERDGWTAHTYFNHLRVLYQWMIEDGLIEADPTARLRRPPQPRPQPQPLTADERARLLDGTSGHLRAWILLALLAGMRVHEVAKIEGEDITQSRIRVAGKGRKVALVPTHPDLWEVAQEYPRSGYWFPSVMLEGRPYSQSGVRRAVTARFREVGIESGGIHRLRATYATELRRKGVDLRVIQKLMRHSSLATTEHYLGVDEDELSAAIGLLGK